MDGTGAGLLVEVRCRVELADHTVLAAANFTRISRRTGPILGEPLTSDTAGMEPVKPLLLLLMASILWMQPTSADSSRRLQA